MSSQLVTARLLVILAFALSVLEPLRLDPGTRNESRESFYKGLVIF